MQPGPRCSSSSRGHAIRPDAATAGFGAPRDVVYRPQAEALRSSRAVPSMVCAPIDAAMPTRAPLLAGQGLRLARAEASAAEIVESIVEGVLTARERWVRA